MQIEGKYADRMIKRDVFNMKKEKTRILVVETYIVLISPMF